MGPNTMVIDGDGIIYMFAYTNREHKDIESLQKGLDDWMNDLLKLTKIENFIGVLAGDNSRCFRYDTYKYAPYKGSRQGEVEEYVAFWKPVIREHLCNKWGFVKAPAWMETDDLVAFIANNNPKMVISSPDKDLKQIAGYFYNYKDIGTEKHKGLETVTPDQATYNFNLQMIIGDSTDGIAGITGMGEVKGKKLLSDTDPIFWESTIRQAYFKQYGKYYGEIIYQETLRTLMLLIPLHHLFDAMLKAYGKWWEPYLECIRKSENYVKSVY